MSDFDFDKTKARKSIPGKTPMPSVTPPTPEIDTSKLGQAENKDEKKPEYSQEELLQIFDEILFSNEYTEDFDIRGRLKVTFKTRTVKEIQAIDKHLDSMGASLISTVEGVRSVMHLESALVAYNGKDLSTLKGPDKTKFIEELPGAIVGALMITLSKFDNKIALACEAGKENF